MSRVSAVIVTLALIFGICGFEMYYVNQSVEEMTGLLDDCRQAAEEKDYKKADTLLTHTSAIWNKRRLLLAAITEQSLLDEVDDQLLYAKALVKHHPEEAVPTIVLCRCNIKEMNYREQFSITSLF